MSNIISPEIKDASKLTNEEWKEWTKTVWSIANISDGIHPAAYPPEILKHYLKHQEEWPFKIIVLTLALKRTLYITANL